MNVNMEKYEVDVLDVSKMDYTARITAASFQGLINRDGPRLFLDYGIYDDPSARKTNEDFLPDDLWYSKYREAIGHSDLNNLEYYKKLYPLMLNFTTDFFALLKKHQKTLKGAVIWDPEFPDTLNLALMIGGLENLLVIHPAMQNRLLSVLPLQVVEDLRGRWWDRTALYTWAFQHLFPRCNEGKVACYEPGWQRAEFTDYIVQNRIFVYSLSTFKDDRIFIFGQMLLLLLIGGPPLVRNLIFNLRLDGLIKRAALRFMGLRSKETALATRIQRAVKPAPFPTIFGWHCCRDDELAFMVHLSANGLRLIPSHLAGNFSFHSKLPLKTALKQEHASCETVALQKDKVYLTFTLSDGDQLVLMNTAELGNWNLPERGQVPFNWEVQPLLVELAPALLGRYYDTKTPLDYLIAGPSGAGYVIPPLISRLNTYLEESECVCRRADIRVVTSYIGDPPARVVRQHAGIKNGFIGFLAGYVHFGRTPYYYNQGRPFIANRVPSLEQVSADCTEILETVQKLIEEEGEPPRFIGVHLFAYRTMISDVHKFMQTLDPSRVQVVRADEFLIAAARHLQDCYNRD